MLFRNLQQRDLRPELMDDPGLDDTRHRKALDGLVRVNLLSGTGSSVWGPIRKRARREGLREMSVLDIGCGGGDVACDLWQRAAQTGLRLRITGVDKSPFAIETAQRRADGLAVPAKFVVREALSFDETDEQKYDVVMCSLFLHHLNETDGVELLRRMAHAARRLVVVNDLLRCSLGYWAAQVVGRVISRSKIVHLDGPQSVAAAFRLDEVRELAYRAGLWGAQLRRVWPFRYLLSWETAPCQTDLKTTAFQQFSA